MCVGGVGVCVCVHKCIIMCVCMCVCVSNVYFTESLQRRFNMLLTEYRPGQHLTTLMAQVQFLDSMKDCLFVCWRLSKYNTHWISNSVQNNTL